MSKVRVRAYCHGLGDCNLIEVADPAGGASFWMLIDCGIHSSAKGGKDRIDKVVADIATQTGRLDVIVATHEHWDHISGFSTANFAGFAVGEVWLAWTEKPGDELADELDRFKGDALTALTAADQRLQALGSAGPAAGALAKGVAALRGFEFGLTGEKSRAAREAVVALGQGNVRYLEPGGVVPLPKGLGVTAFVLGPPRDRKALRLLDSANTYGIAQSLNASFALAAGTLDANADPGAPFDETEGEPLAAGPENRRHAGFLRDRYSGDAIDLPVARVGDPDPPRPDQQWRRIDGDWLAASADLAMQLDSRTNNTSLVLALDLGRSEQVLLFAADAQIGNWGSWAAVAFEDGTTTTADLLARTVFYKVGHHGSSNATAMAGGLEAMTHPDLKAFIPTDQTMAENVGWGAIPAPGLLTRLSAKGTVCRSDKVDGALFVDYQFG